MKNMTKIKKQIFKNKLYSDELAYVLKPGNDFASCCGSSFQEPTQYDQRYYGKGDVTHKGIVLYSGMPPVIPDQHKKNEIHVVNTRNGLITFAVRKR